MIDIILSTLSLLFVIILSNYQYVLFGALILLLIIIHVLNPQPIIFYVVCGVGGPIAESLAIKFGKNTWKYSEPAEPLNIPIWLIPLWAIAGVFVSRIAEILH